MNKLIPRLTSLAEITFGVICALMASLTNFQLKILATQQDVGAKLILDLTLVVWIWDKSSFGPVTCISGGG